MNLKLALAALVTMALAAPAWPAVMAGDTATKLRLPPTEAGPSEPDRVSEPPMLRLAQAGGAAGDGVIFDLYQDVQALKEEIRRLRGSIEELKFRARQREQGQRDLYKSLDERLKRLEGGGIAGGPAPRGGGVQSVPGGTPRRGADGGGQAGGEQAYLAAFEKLKAGNYEQARGDFQAFLDNHPRSQYADNAWYWLGESHYVDRQYDPALQAFLHVVEDHPDSSKVPGALYKRGIILDEQGSREAAQRELQRVLDDYPDADIAGLARERLAAITGG